MAEDKQTEGNKRDRSPSFPYIGLAKAVERTRQLYNKAKRFEVLLADAARDWELGPKSSSTLQTVAALLAYGLVEDSGGGATRKVKVSEVGWRILEDERPGAREKLLAAAALKPKLIAEYAERWKDGRPDDAHSVSQLKFDSNFTDEAARTFLRVFDETIRFTSVAGGDKIGDKAGAKAPVEAPPQVIAKVGDYVQWTSGGSDQFAPARRVDWVAEDQSHLRVHGSPTGIPMAEVTVVDAPAPPKPTITSSPDARGDINVYLTNGRLQITADVDAQGLERLKQVLSKYDEILKLLQ